MKDLAKETIEQRLGKLARIVVRESFEEDYYEAMGEDFKKAYRAWYERLLGACFLAYGEEDYREKMFQLLHTAMLEKCGLGIEHLKNPY